MAIRKSYTYTLEDMKKVYARNHVDPVTLRDCVRHIINDCYGNARRGLDYFLVYWSQHFDYYLEQNNNIEKLKSLIIDTLKAREFTVEIINKDCISVSGWGE